MTQTFVVVGLDHRHIYELVGGLLDAGLQCAGYWTETSDPRVLQGFQKRFPHLQPIADRAALIEHPAATILVSAAIPAHRAALAAEAMRHDKDVLLDKPGVTAPEGLALLERTAAETGRIVSICFSERFLTPSTLEALRLVRQGAIGRVIQTAGFGPHRLNRPLRPTWFFDPAQYGGILCDIASHQIDQFLAFTGADDAQIVQSTIGTVPAPRTSDLPAFQNFGEILLRTQAATGYCRVDWFTADGLPTWGDGRLTILGTEGTIELRKYIDPAGRPGPDHLFLTDGTSTRHIDCAALPTTYFADFAKDCRDRTETVMPQRQTFTVCRLALEAQTRADHITLAGGPPS